MAAVYVNNLVVNAGSDFNQEFTLEGSGNNFAFDLTDYTAISQMRKWSGSSTAIDFTVDIVYPESGKITLNLSSEQTLNIKPGRYVYDVIIIDPFGVKSRVIEGMVLVTEGVTR